MHTALAERGHGAKGALAKHLKVRADAITRMMNLDPDRETREIRAHELVLMESFFGSNVLDTLVPRPQMIPIVSWVSAGHLLRDDVSQLSEKTIRIPDLPKGDWIALEVVGDSMNRISPPESIICVNRKDRKLVGNACYVIADEEGNATYKRYRPNPMRFEPVSTNPAHEPIFPEREPVIVGRAILSLLWL